MSKFSIVHLILPYSTRPAQDTVATCPQCGGTVHRHGSRRRRVITTAGKGWCQVLRFVCTRCEKAFTRLPPFLLPFKHYAASEIETALRHIFEGGKLSRGACGAGEGTLRRWRDEFSGKMQEWAGLLESMVFKLSREPPSIIRLVSHPLRRLEEALSRLPALPSRWPVLVQTLWWLKKPHPL